jgi:glycosyltransferase involved in cell wall biosynthesis
VIDVILPALNEAPAIATVLERIPAGFRPIVVDNGSTDATAEIARARGVSVVHESTRGFGAVSSGPRHRDRRRRVLHGLRRLA